MQKIKLSALKCAVGVLKGIYAVVKLIPPRDKVTFISRQSDEPGIDIRLLAQAVKDRKPKYETVILSKKLNGASYIFHILKQIYHISTSKVVILDSYCIAISVLNHKKSLQVIQMWHAMGSMKKFGYAMLGKEEGSDPDVARIMKMHRGYDEILISSKWFIRDYEEGFRSDPAIVREIPLPKADLLTNREYKEAACAKLYAKYPFLEEKKNIMYCPTFRKETDERNSESIKKLIDCVDFEKYNFIYKPHSLSDTKIEDDRVFSEYDEKFEMMFACDFVISDYSSIIYEAGLLGLPVYLYAYDWVEYSTKREINIDLEKEVPSVFTSDPAEIIKAIEKNEFDHEAFRMFIDKNIVMPEGKTVCEAIIDIMNI